MNNPIAQFADLAAEYCRWAEGPPANEAEEGLKAISLVSRLYTQAHLLPDVEGDEEAPNISAEEWTKVFKRFGALPFNYYGECFNPLTVPPEEPVISDLADDLADIWRDLKPGLRLFEAGHHSSAAWHWRFHFMTHWGHHASGALYALHHWFAENSEL